MSGLYLFTGGSATVNCFKVNTATAFVIAGDADAPTRVAWFRVTEIAGGTANLTIEVYDATLAVSYYIRNALAMTAKQSLLFEEGYPLGKNQFLRVTTSSANQVDVVAAVLHPSLDAGGRLSA